MPRIPDFLRDHKSNGNGNGKPHIYHLPDAINGGPQDVVLYCRVSSWSNKSNGSLDRQHDDMVREHQDAGLRIRRIVQGVELGQLETPRPRLMEAIESAKGYNAILSTRDLSRFIRSESYHRQTNPHAEPTAAELIRLANLAHGVTLATVEPPGWCEGRRHSEAIERSAKAGRPSSIDFKTGYNILCLWCDEPEGDSRPSYAEIARRVGKTKSAVARFLNSVIPYDGRTWKDFGSPDMYLAVSKH